MKQDLDTAEINQYCHSSELILGYFWQLFFLLNFFDSCFSLNFILITFQSI